MPKRPKTTTITKANLVKKIKECSPTIQNVVRLRYGNLAEQTHGPGYTIEQLVHTLNRAGVTHCHKLLIRIWKQTRKDFNKDIGGDS